jgi:hypothetical protein
MNIPVIINNRDLFTWPKKMVEDLSKFDNIGDIIIVDNESTYEPLLEWYLTKPCEIFYSKNLGEASPWKNKIPEKKDYNFYVVTDSDLDLSETPKDCLMYIFEKLKNHKEYSKIGLSLCNYNVSDNSPYHHFLKMWAENKWNINDVEDGLLIKQDVDTTFALYDIKRHSAGPSCSTNFPYSAKHVPWEITWDVIRDMKNKNYEFYYYLKNAGYASSYKRFIDFDKIINE